MDQSWEFFYTHATAIGGIVVLLITILEFVFFRKTQKPWKKYLILIQSTIASLAFLLLIYHTWAPKTTWELWAEDIETSFSSCLKEVGLVLPLKENKFDCLVKATQTSDFPNVSFRNGELNGDVTNNYSESLKSSINARSAMEYLFSIPEVANVLKETYGIYPNLFLGTGLSKPNGEVSGRQNGVREYFVTNFCANTSQCDAKITTERDKYPNHPKIWEWKIDNANALKSDLMNTKVADILFDFQQSRSGSNFDTYKPKIKDYLSSGQTRTQTILIRFSYFNPEYYVGTVGHPDRKLTFFSDLREVHDYPLREALKLAGIPSRKTDEKKINFIWLIILEPGSLDYFPASWDEILQDISNSK